MNLDDAPTDTCIGCGKEFVVYELFYDLDYKNPKCKWCLIKEAQDKFGKDNVILGNEN